FFSITGFILLIDPQNIFRIINIKGINRIKPFVHHGGMRETKSLDLEIGQYDTLILGTSRARGIQISHPFFDNRVTYNAALDGANFYEIYEVFKFSIEHNPIKTIVLGLDVQSFTDARKGIKSFYESRFANKNILISNIQDLTSPTMLERSIETVRANFDSTEEIVSTDADQVFQETGKTANYTKRFQEVNLVKPLPPGAIYNSPQRFELLEDLIRTALDNNIELFLYISPVHARNLEDIRLSGLYPEFEDWKRLMVDVVARVNQDYAARNPVALWDFSGYNSITSEEFYQKWYWDKSHYKRTIGDMILDVMISKSGRDESAPADFGVNIDQTNIESHLQSIRQDQSNYHQTFNDEIKKLEKIAAAERASTGNPNAD
ncbi:MAG: hypothetical protein AAGG02_19270, partial [Cyanobacteria bacterium P01_H01_bin.15]